MSYYPDKTEVRINPSFGLSLTTMGFIASMILMVLKLTEVIAIDWFWVWFWLWIPLAIAGAIIIICLMVLLILYLKDK